MGDVKISKRIAKFFIVLICILVVISIAWAAFSLVGRVKAGRVIPDSASFRLSISNPVRLLDGILAHESLHEITAVPALAQAAPFLNALEESSLMKNRLLRFAARGNIELALLPVGPQKQAQKYGSILAVWDMGLLSPLLRIFPFVSGFINVPNLYYVQAGKNSRFEYRMDDMTFYIGPYRNLLFITDNSAIFESRSEIQTDAVEAYSSIKPSDYDAALLLSADFTGALLADQDANIAAVLKNIDFDSGVEAGISIFPKKIELRLMAGLSSQKEALSRLLEQRSQAPDFTERLPSTSQYATILSAGTLDELYKAAQVFSGPELGETLRLAENSSRALLGMTLNDLLFSWPGKEFAVFGMEGRPHPVYLIQIADERKRQDVFDRAFKSIVLNEDVRLNLDGVRIPRIEIPEFLQFLLRRWNLFLPSPYYTVYKDCLIVSESAETLLSALRAMQRNDALPKTAVWKDIAGGKTSGGFNAKSAFSLYYSLDLSLPFFLRKNTALSGFLACYRQGLVRMGFDRGVVDISLSLIPGSGSGVTLVSSHSIDAKGRISNRVYGDGGVIFLSVGDSVISFNVTDNSTREFSGQGPLWVISADGLFANAWIVSERGRVTLVNSELEPLKGFPVLTGQRLSSPPVSYNGILYICDEDGKVHTIDETGSYGVWETSFPAALRAPPSFLTVSSRGRGGTALSYAAVYPKSFFGEIWLLDTEGSVLPGWPAPISGIGFGSPLLFAPNNNVRAAFISQAGELFIFDENAISIAPFPIQLDGVFYQQPVFDGEYLWLVSSDGTLFCVSLAGEVLYQRIAGFSVMEEGYITVFDSDGDKTPEIFITGEGNALYAYSRNFRSLENFPLPMWGKPLFIDSSGRGKAEIIGLGMDRRLYRWQFK